MPASEGFPGQPRTWFRESLSTQHVQFAFSEGCDCARYVKQQSFRVVLATTSIFVVQIVVFVIAIRYDVYDPIPPSRQEEGFALNRSFGIRFGEIWRLDA